LAAILAAALISYTAFSQTEAAGTARESAAPGQTVSPGNSADAAAPAGETAARDASAASRVEEEALPNFFDDPAAGSSPAAARSPSAAPAIFRMVLVLALVAALIYLAVFFLRRLSRPQTEQNPHLKILASTHLGAGRYVHVVSVGGLAWLIGSGEGGVRHIADITDQEAVDAMRLDLSRQSAETPGGPFPSFRALLKKFSGPVSPAEQDRLEAMRRRRERFKRF
jgi:flagellar biosynthetic protein FliO